MTTGTDDFDVRATGPAGAGREAAFLAGFGALYYALAVFAAGLPFQAHFPLFIWPAEGLALGALLVVARSRWALYLGVAFAATLAVGLQAGTPMGECTIRALTSAIKPALVAAGLLRLAGGRVHIATLAGLSGFLVNLVPLTGIVSLAETSLDWWRFGTAFRDQWTVSFVSEFLAMILFAPFALVWGRGGWDDVGGTLRGRLAEAIVLFAGLVVTTYVVFSTPADSTRFVAPLAYLCSPFLIWAALRFGLHEATLGLAVFGLICYWHTAHGSGPFSIRGFSDWTSLLYLQGFLATAVVTTLFAAALLAEREAQARTTQAWRQRYEAAIRAGGNLLYELDPASGRILWDGDTQAVLGVPREEIENTRLWADRVHPEDHALIRGIGERLLSGEIPHIDVEYRIRRADGEWITVGVNGYAIEDPTHRKAKERRRIIGFVSDVSERVRADAERQALAAQLRQAEKMEAVGRLAGGIAHDFNNILGAILGYGELAQARAQADAQLKRYVDTIVKAGNRAKALVAQILAYSRAEGEVRGPVVFGPVIAEVRELLRGSTPAEVEIRVAIAPEEALVMGDPTRLHQLVMNLASNAIQAMSSGGVLEISLATRTLAAPQQTRLAVVAPGEWVVLEVKDTGEGIAPTVIDRIFEPFFSTKPVGRGTGMGLALVHSIVKEHGGAIDVASEVGRGTTFTVWFPRLDKAGVSATPAPKTTTGRGQAILAVDDEPEMLAALEEMLAALGYEPVGFTESPAALAAFRGDADRFSLVITDQVMPGLTGTQLAFELRKVRPAIPIVIATGFGGQGFEAQALAAGVNRVLRKPYAMRDMGEALATFLSRN